mmetsp:Transcript_84305/g.176449  ORF Transcript_84305/g.176449 Transcript_84305/m.176449 type:complete len:206 (+) Transcript_84305:2253-2870(+)
MVKIAVDQLPIRVPFDLQALSPMLRTEAGATSLPLLVYFHYRVFIFSFVGVLIPRFRILVFGLGLCVRVRDATAGCDTIVCGGGLCLHRSLAFDSGVNGFRSCFLVRQGAGLRRRRHGGGDAPPTAQHHPRTDVAPKAEQKVAAGLLIDGNSDVAVLLLFLSDNRGDKFRTSVELLESLKIPVRRNGFVIDRGGRVDLLGSYVHA